MSSRPLPRFLRILLLLYLAAGLFAIAVAALGEATFSGLFLVVVAMPWTLLLEPLQKMAGSDAHTFNLVFLSLGVAANATLIYLMGRL